MYDNILKFLTFYILISIPEITQAQDIWAESFLIAEKGIWGSDGSNIISDFDGVDWTLEFENISLENTDDYAKTVTTNGGRFEVRDIDGEITWLSPWIDIREYKDVDVQLTAYETGSGANEENKYLKAFYCLNDSEKILFKTNGINTGNWGSNIAEQTGLEGDSLQIIVYIANYYSSDKVTLDEIIISGESKVVLPPIEPFDIVINEIMADPNPVVGLPQEEYIELYNRTGNPVKLNGWTIKVRDTEKKIPNVSIDSCGYLILCKTTTVDSFSIYGPTIGIPGYPSLINSGATIQIKNDDGIVIDQITYSADWYYDDEKDNGGWSLERIDPYRVCGQSLNWTASVDEIGGTPGSVNSVREENTDTEAPYLLWATPETSNQLSLMFSENMDTALLFQNVNYSLSDGMGVPNEIQTKEYGEIILIYDNQFVEDKIYTLNINNLTDECGNLIVETSAEIQWIKVNPGDVVINEILFDPYPDGVDFVELVNVSQKNIPLNKLYLASRDDNMELKQIYALSEDKSVFNSGSYLLCTSDIEGVSNFYYSECPECFLEMEKFPTYSNDKGYVVLLADSTEVVDEFFYNEKMHSEILYDEEGVSLERVNFTAETNQSYSWHSASESVGFATPGYQNSQFNENVISNRVYIEPESFSPNLDGYNDQMFLYYQLDQSGYIANAWIYNSSGQQIMQLMKNQIIGTSGSVSWNGENESGQRQPLGAYIILTEIFNLDGKVERFKKVCVLTDIVE